MEGQLIVYIVVGAFQILSILGGGGMMFYRLGQGNQRLDSALNTINDLKSDFATLRPLLTEVALQKQEIAQLRQWYDELRHGEGMVFPFGSHMSKKTGG